MDTTTATDNPAAIRAELATFTGTTCWFRHPIFRDLVTTEGVQYLVERAGAQWLVDAIATVQLAEPEVRGEAFQVWRLRVGSDRSATLTCTDGNEEHLFEARVAWTDFPLEEIDLWFANGTLYLPSEH